MTNFKRNSPGCSCCAETSPPTVDANCGLADSPSGTCPSPPDFCDTSPGPRALQLQMDLSGMQLRCLRHINCQCLPDRPPNLGVPCDSCQLQSCCWCGDCHPNAYDCYGAIECACPDPAGTYVMNFINTASPPGSFRNNNEGACHYWYPFGSPLAGPGCADHPTVNYTNPGGSCLSAVSQCASSSGFRGGGDSTGDCFNGVVDGLLVRLIGARGATDCEARIEMWPLCSIGSLGCPAWELLQSPGAVHPGLHDCSGTPGFTYDITGLPLQIGEPLRPDGYCTDGYEWFDRFNDITYTNCSCECSYNGSTSATIKLPA